MNNTPNEQPINPTMQISYIEGNLKQVKEFLKEPLWSQKTYWNG
jgi:hypothetical protein